jgi:hypothetical protein
MQEGEDIASLFAQTAGETANIRSTKRSPRLLWEPKQRLRHITNRRSSRSGWLCRVPDYAALMDGDASITTERQFSPRTRFEASVSNQRLR